METCETARWVRGSLPGRERILKAIQTNNAGNQSSCDVAFTLAIACSEQGKNFQTQGRRNTSPSVSQFHFPDLRLGDQQQGDGYLGPSESDATPCLFNTVFYSMQCACAICQGHDYIRCVMNSTRDRRRLQIKSTGGRAMHLTAV